MSWSFHNIHIYHYVVHFKLIQCYVNYISIKLEQNEKRQTYTLTRQIFACSNNICVSYQCRRCGFNPWLREILWRWTWQSTSVCFPVQSHGKRSLVGYSPLSLKSVGCDLALLSNYSMHCSPPGSSVHGIVQASILEWVAISFSRWSSWSRDQTRISCIASGFFTTEPLGKSHNNNINDWKTTIKKHQKQFSRFQLCSAISWNVLF